MKKKQLVGAVAGLCGVALIAGVVCFRYAGLWLVVEDPLPDGLDVVFTFAGELSRNTFSRELVDSYENVRWVVSAPASLPAPHGTQGFDPDRLVLVTSCRNTCEETESIARYVDSLLDANRCERKLRVALVSSPYHMRRIDLFADRFFGKMKKKVDIICVPVPFGKFHRRETYEHWWKYPGFRPVVYQEWGKTVYYWVTGHLGFPCRGE